MPKMVGSLTKNALPITFFLKPIHMFSNLCPFFSGQSGNFIKPFIPGPDIWGNLVNQIGQNAKPIALKLCSNQHIAGPIAFFGKPIAFYHGTNRQGLHQIYHFGFSICSFNKARNEIPSKYN